MPSLCNTTELAASLPAPIAVVSIPSPLKVVSKSPSAAHAGLCKVVNPIVIIKEIRTLGKKTLTKNFDMFF